jgi:hypothetical protein
VAIVNSGFPEIHQNAVALAICEEFAAQSGIAWAGGLALGGGGMVGGQPLTETKRSGPPVKHVIQALDLTAAALSDGLPVPAQAVKLMAKNPARRGFSYTRRKRRSCLREFSCHSNAARSLAIERSRSLMLRIALQVKKLPLISTVHSLISTGNSVPSLWRADRSRPIPKCLIVGSA